MGFIDAEVGDAFLNSLKLAVGCAIVRHDRRLRRRLPAREDPRRSTRCVRSSACWRCCRWPCRAWCSASATSSSSTRPDNPLHGLYQTLAILVVCTIVHFYTTGHLTAVTALKQIDAEFEAVSASLKVPFFTTFWRVTVPICMPTLIDIARYFFVNAMTTISAVVFLYSPETKVAAIAILNLDEAGEIGAAAAMRGADHGRLDRRDAALHRPRRLGRPAHPGLAAHRRPLSARIARRPDKETTETMPMARDPILLTPGPLTTTERTKQAMLRDWGSWDASFNAVTAEHPQAPAGDRARRRHARRRAAAGQRHLRGRGRDRRRSCRATATCWCSTTAPTASASADLATLMGRRTTILGRAGRPAGLAAPSSKPRSAPTPASPTSASSTARPAPACSIRSPRSLQRLRAPRQGPDRRRDELVRGAADRRARGPLRRARRGQRQVPRRRARDGLRLLQASDVARRRRRQLALAGDGPARPVRLHGEDRPVALHAADPRRRRAR